MVRGILFLVTVFILNACTQEQTIADSATSKPGNSSMESEGSSKNAEAKEFLRDFSVASDDMVIGGLQSKVVLVEYFSPTCPHCGHYHQKIFPEISEKYIDNNKIAYVFREFIGNKQDLDASILARCNGDIETYIKFIDVVLSQQNNWAFSKNYREILTNIGSIGGISPESFAKCLNDQNKIKTLIGNTRLVANEPKFVGTPTFFINGKQFNERYTFEELSKALDKELTIDN